MERLIKCYIKIKLPWLYDQISGNILFFLMCVFVAAAEKL